jgi:hypothetical protein
MGTETILLADLSPMLECIVAGVLACRPHLRVLRGSARRGVVAAAAESGARLVVVSGGNPSDLKDIDATLAEAAGLSVLVLNRDGAWACLHGLRLATERLDDLSAAEMLRVVDGTLAARETD